MSGRFTHTSRCCALTHSLACSAVHLGPVAAPQVGQLLELIDSALDVQKYRAIDKWATHLRALHQTVLNKLQ